jgi:endonuclease YncB( thermonuclease family)
MWNSVIEAMTLVCNCSVARAAACRGHLVSRAVVGGLTSTAHTAARGSFSLHGFVSRVVDGDTLVVQLDGGRAERVRLIGIDTPEVGRCGAARATKSARALALNKNVVLKGDRTQATRDRYRRLLAYAWLPGGKDFGFQQLKRGLARVYVFDKPFERLSAYRRAENIGRNRPGSLSRSCRSGGKPPPPPRNGCDPSYPAVCIPPPPPDLDCADVPYSDFKVVGADPHGFDGDRDGIGCES